MSHSQFQPKSSSKGAAIDAPLACPACKGKSLLATDKNKDSNTYWRCLGCGEVWSPSRLHVNERPRWG